MSTFRNHRIMNNFYKFLRFSSIIVLLFIINSCSNKKNTFLSRTFHKTTTHYNGFFNAREEMRSAERSLWEAHEENWEEMLPLFLYGDPSVYGNMEKSIEKCSRAIDKHSIFIKKKEYNSWIDDTYLLMGKSFFFKNNLPKAEEIFKYVEKQFREEEISYDARLWLAVLYKEEGNYIKAASILEKLEEEKKNFPKKFEPWFRKVYADFYIDQENYDFAAEELEQSIALTKKKKEKARLTFILAQLYDKQGKSKKSIDTFAKVLKLRPNYEMEFYAKINQALAFDSRADGTEVREVLEKLLKEKKYAEFKDQIYYALAQVEFADNNNDLGIDHLVKSTEVSVNNPRQKGKSFLSLSEIYFEQREYRIASGYYDSTMTYLPTDYENYEAIKKTKDNLSELVGHLIIVQEKDSLIALAELPEKERDKVLLKVIKDKRDDLAEKRRLEQEQKENELANRLAGANDRRTTGGGKSGAWYFYNPNTKSLGFTEFKRKFGERKWEDNWKRKDKSQILSLEDGEEEEEIDDGDTIPTLEELLERLPLTDEKMETANKKIASSMYQIGRIYTEKFDDTDNSIESFEELSIRYPEEDIISRVYYHLYILYLEKEEGGNYLPPDHRSTSAYYKELITEEYPYSEFALIIDDPERESDQAKRMAEIMANYKNTYRQYRRKNYTEVLTTCTKVINDEPGNKLLAKYYMLKALVIGKKKDRENYVKTLQEIVAKFPNTEEEEEARILLGAIGESVAEKKVVKEDKLAGIKEKEEEKPKKEEKVYPKAEYSTKLNTSHYFAMVAPKDYDTNELKNKFSDFNQSSFASEGLKVTSSFLTKELRLILVRTFKEKDPSMNYYEAANANEEILGEINAQGFDTFVISSKNFAQLFKSKDTDDYMEFFKENYLK